MRPRLFCNITYAWLVRGLPPDSRDKLDRELTAPLAGWDEIQRRAFGKLAAIAAAEDEGG